MSCTMAPLKAWALCFLYLSTSVAKPVYDLQASVLDPATYRGSRPLFSSSSIKSISYGLPNKIILLHRDNEYTIWRARPHSVIHPSQIAAITLDAFYTAIFNQATQEWSSRPPRNSFWIRSGNLQLLFDSVGGPIPWDLVAKFAWKLRSATRLGWTGTYEIVYMNGPATRSVGVSLEVVEQGIGTQKRSLLTSLDHLPHRVTSSPIKATLVKRNKISLTYSKVYGSIMPVFLASEMLRDFFIAVAREARNTWISRPESALFTVTQGPFQLTVSCLGSTLPWPVLGMAAEKFSDYADHLFVNTFDAFYTEIASKISIGFSLRILEGLAGGITDLRISGPSARNLEHKTPPIKSPTSLKRRANANPGLTMTKFRSFQVAALVPTMLAASRLEDFYNIVAMKIETGFFKSWPPSKNIILSLFEFELSITCDSINVPWSFVEAFVIDMAHWSSKQFSGLYEATIRGDGPLNNLVFIVSMRLRQDGQQPNGR